MRGRKLRIVKCTKCGCEFWLTKPPTPKTICIDCEYVKKRKNYKRDVEVLERRYV